LLYQDPDPQEEEYSIEQMHIHELFNEEAHLNHDIALVKVKTKLNRGIRFDKYVQPICLPEPDTQYVPGTNCTIAGWGSGGQPGNSGNLNVVLNVMNTT